MQDHPRSRGNNNGSGETESVTAGSPPLAREQLILNIFAHYFLGITPARAGTTSASVQEGSQKRDHPRSRGNNPPARPDRHQSGGSPPLAREQPSASPPVIRSIRITPARAGTTRRHHVRRMPRRDHPRSRGNNHPEELHDNQISGSPPLAREQLINSIAVLVFPGITPARAGTT